MKTNPSLRESLETRVVRTTILKFPEISKMLSDVRFFFCEVNKCPDSAHIKEIGLKLLNTVNC